MKLKKIRVISEKERHPLDVDRIVEVMRYAGYDVTREQAKELWEMYSDCWAAGWLTLPSSDDEIIRDVSLFFEEIDDD